ncbi:MAG: type II secretion system protein [Planctomycetota bacterium]|jgi:type II secretory pathway pseudopilin PulG
MKKFKSEIGVTLVEMLVVVAVITLLVSMVVGIAARIDNQGRERLTENTFALLNAALGQFKDYGYQYKDEDFRDFEFPIDCNDLVETDLESELGKALDKVCDISGNHDPNFSGSEALYFFLSQVPTSRQTLDKIDGSLITNEDSDRDEMEIRVGSRKYPLQRVIDPWGETLRYSYYENRYENTREPDFDDEPRNFPLITSAGPDRIFGTDDDMTNR